MYPDELMGVGGMVKLSGQTYIDADAPEDEIDRHGEDLRAALTERALKSGLLYAPVCVERTLGVLELPEGYAKVVVFEGYAHVGVRM